MRRVRFWTGRRLLTETGRLRWPGPEGGVRQDVGSWPAVGRGGCRGRAAGGGLGPVRAARSAGRAQRARPPAGVRRHLPRRRPAGRFVRRARRPRQPGIPARAACGRRARRRSPAPVGGRFGDRRDAAAGGDRGNAGGAGRTVGPGFHGGVAHRVPAGIGYDACGVLFPYRAPRSVSGVRAVAVRRRPVRPACAVAGRGSGSARGVLGAAGDARVRRRPLSRALPAGPALDVRQGVSAGSPAHPARRRGGAPRGICRGGRRRPADGQPAAGPIAEPVAGGAGPRGARRLRRARLLRSVLRARPGRAGRPAAARPRRGGRGAAPHAAVRRRHRGGVGAARRRGRRSGVSWHRDPRRGQLGQRPWQRLGARGAVSDDVCGHRPAGARCPDDGARLGSPPADAWRAGTDCNRTAGGAGRVARAPRLLVGGRGAGRPARTGVSHLRRGGAGGAGVPRAASRAPGCLDCAGDGRSAAGAGTGRRGARAGDRDGGGGRGCRSDGAAGRRRDRRPSPGG